MMDGKVAVITGSGRGIGRHIAKTFADAGADVVVADIVPLDTVEREIQERGVQALAVPTDVRSEEQVQSLVNATMEKFGRIDVLVNNAAIVTHFLWGLPRWPRVRDMEKEFWDKVIGTNLGGTFLCTKYVLPHMEAQRSGHVVSTMGGANPAMFGGSPYGVSKDAIRTFTRFVAEEERVKTEARRRARAYVSSDSDLEEIREAVVRSWLRKCKALSEAEMQRTEPKRTNPSGVRD